MKAKKKRKIKNPRKSLIKSADFYWGRVVRGRDKNKCCFCGEPGNQPHHINRRGRFSTRWVVLNGVTLCYRHHFRHTWIGSNPDLYLDMIYAKIGKETYKKLKRESENIFKVSLEGLKIIRDKLKIQAGESTGIYD